MFEDRIEKTIEFLSSRSIGDQDSITLRQIDASDVPEAIKRIFDAEVEQWVEDEKSRLLTSPHFHYNDDEILPLFDDIIGRARNYASFTRGEYAQTLDKSVKLLFNYICRPQWTMSKYLFADRENATTESLLESLEYFVDYEYYRLILAEYFRSKNLSVIHARKFEELVENIDKEVIRTFDSRQLAQLADPLFTLFSLRSQDEEKRAPLEALSIFFDDKDFPMIVERLDLEKEHRSEITIHELILLISDVDFSVSQDIFSIVSQRTRGMGLKPEKNVTAGEEFDIPRMAESLHEGQASDEPPEEDLDEVLAVSDETGEAAVDEIPEMEEAEEEPGSMVDEGILDLEDDIVITEDEDEKVDIPASEIIEVPEEESEEFSAESIVGEDTAELDVIGLPEEEAESGIQESLDVPETGRDDIDLPDDADIEAPSYEEDEAGTAEAGEDAVQDFEEDDLVLQVEESDEELPTAENEYYAEDEFVLPSDYETESEEEEDYSDITVEDATLPDDIYVPDEEHVPADDDISVPDTIIEDDEEAPDSGDELDSVVLEGDEETVDLPDLDTVDLPEIELDSIDLENPDAGTDDNDFLIPDFRSAEESEAENLFKDIALEELMEEDESEEDTGSGHAAESVEHRPAAETRREVQVQTEEEVAPVASAEVLEAYGDLNEQMAAADRKKYIKRLFSKDEEAFSRAIGALNAKASWREASEYIDELFIKHGVDMYSRVAVKFTDDVYKRYLNKKS